ncbi:ATP-binding cassette domain-containing protein [Alkalibaculum sp. M08DMB]|uniref:ATP-binding cassette domain-containing protein n=1 Tax=Alkalibaculum sporogenes TaxID=2655001 RepID=A0A6A7K897_9FIRM|nr:ABC transporter ATP-binding protein [Alkalibaculum sporogenes]MPW25729.1 ATP-binding cassette domain-containing protein [Alkalibaculum sporogenes]
MLVKVNNLVKRYDQLVAIDHLNLEIKEGEIFGLLGPNGSGKSTFINCILSLLKYDKGSIYIFNKPMTPDAYDIKRDIGVIFQNVAVFDELTVYENIAYFCSLYVKDKSEVKRLTHEAISFVSLEEYIKHYPKKLSGGLLRRLNIACGIAHKPKLIILDEPTVAVDPQSRNKILEGIKELNKQGATVIYTTHYMEEAEQLCNRIAIMDKGKILALGSKEELKEMISIGEKITIEVFELNNIRIQEIKRLPNVLSVEYQDTILTIKSIKGKNNLVHIIEYLSSHEIIFHQVITEQPSLNDVFLEITGKELRD